MDHEYEYCTHENTTHNEYMYFPLNTCIFPINTYIILLPTTSFTPRNRLHTSNPIEPLSAANDLAAQGVCRPRPTPRETAKSEKAPKMSRNGVNYGVSTLFMSLITQLSLDHESE